MSRKVKTKGKPPTLRELVLSQTGKHDHLLEKPENIRKYFKLDPSCQPIRFISNEYFIDDGNYFNYDMGYSRTKGYDIYNTITDNGSVAMFLYQIDKLGPVFGPSCTESIQWYVGIDSVTIRCFSVRVKDCNDIVGFTEYGTPESGTFPGTLKDLLTEHPYLITQLNLEDDLDNILGQL